MNYNCRVCGYNVEKRVDFIDHLLEEHQVSILRLFNRAEVTGEKHISRGIGSFLSIIDEVFKE